MYTNNFFKYIKLSNEPEPGIFRFWFSCDGNTPGNGYILSAGEQSCYSASKEHVINVSPEDLILLLKLADKFSGCSDLSRIGSDGEVFLCENGQTAEELIHDYFEVLLSLFNKAAASQNTSLPLFRGYCRILEELLFLNTTRRKYKNQYSLSFSHPMVLMQHYVETLSREEIDLYLKNSDSGEVEKSDLKWIQELILQSIFDAQNKNRRELQLMRPNQIYAAAPEQPALYEAVPFNSRESNTEIPAIRLIEKIENYLAFHKDSLQPLSELKIACFGQLADTKTLQDVCRNDGLCTKISLTCFEQDRAAGEYFFRETKKACPDDAKEVYDLLHNGDLETLFNTYHIVLFLDLNCFYRQFQGTKTIEEKSALTNCQWYWKRTEELSNLKFKAKAAYYRVIYDYIGIWLNSYRKELSSRYEFDEQLFHALDMAYKGKADVYLYLDHGDEIAGMKLQNSNVCNDEYYDGKELIVYKFTPQDITDPDQFYKPFSNPENNTGQLEITVSLWKIVKSISNSFCQMLIDKLQKSNIGLGINEIMNTTCVLDCSQIKGGTEAVISYSLQSPDNSGYTEILNEVIRVVLEQAFGTKPLACMRKYFRNLIVHYIVSNSNSISDLLFAHLLSSNRIARITLAPDNQNSGKGNHCNAFLKRSIDFKARNTVYSLIDRLAALRLRTIDNRTEYFVNGFRRSYFPDMSESIFRGIMANINHCCEEWSYTDSRLYVNSKIE